MAERFGIILFLNIFSKKKSNTGSILLYDTHNKKNNIYIYLKDVSFVSVSAQIIIIPIIAYTNKTISLTFIITNILTSYLIGIIIILGFFLVLISFPFLNFAKFIGKSYKLLINLLLFITENTAKIPYSKIYIKAPYLWGIILYYIFVFSFLYFYRKLRTRCSISKNKKLFKNKLQANNSYFTHFLYNIYANTNNPKRFKDLLYRRTDKGMHA